VAEILLKKYNVTFT